MWPLAAGLAGDELSLAGGLGRDAFQRIVVVDIVGAEQTPCGQMHKFAHRAVMLASLPAWIGKLTSKPSLVAIT